MEFKFFNLYGIQDNVEYKVNIVFEKERGDFVSPETIEEIMKDCTNIIKRRLEDAAWTLGQHSNRE